MQSFRGFLPYAVRFEPILVLVVHTKTSREMNFCTNGPMDTISVKSCTTIVDMRQNQDNTAFRRGSELALQANYWTGYLALARTNRLANHNQGEPE